MKHRFIIKPGFVYYNSDNLNIRKNNNDNDANFCFVVKFRARISIVNRKCRIINKVENEN